MSANNITYYVYQYAHPSLPNLGVFVGYTGDLIQIQRSHASNLKCGKESAFYRLLRARGENTTDWVFSVLEEADSLENVKQEYYRICDNLPKVINKMGRGGNTLSNPYYVEHRAEILKQKREQYAANRESILNVKRKKAAKERAERTKAILVLRKKQRREISKEIARLKNQVEIYNLPNDSENNEITSKTEEVSGDNERRAQV